MQTLQKIIHAAEARLALAPVHPIVGLHTWDAWFAYNANYHRQLIGRLIMESGDGTYFGSVPHHALEIMGVAVIGEDGYRGLLLQWLAAARSALENRKGVAG